MIKVDLHVHTTASDGTFTPSEVVEAAVAEGIRVLAVTDHDTLAGNGEALKAAEGKPITVIPGIEISAGFHGRSVHVLGLGLREMTPRGRRILDRILESRRRRNPMIIRKLNILGFQLTYQEVAAVAGGGVIGRPHIARVLIEKGYISDYQEAFQRFLNPGAAAYVHRWRPTVEVAARIILESGGIPVLAHPGLMRGCFPRPIHSCVTDIARQGVQGLEANYSSYSKKQKEYFIRLAEHLNLFVTGGSDFHGRNKPDTHLGRGAEGEWITIEFAEELLKRLGLPIPEPESDRT